MKSLKERFQTTKVSYDLIRLAFVCQLKSGFLGFTASQKIKDVMQLIEAL